MKAAAWFYGQSFAGPRYARQSLTELARGHQDGCPCSICVAMRRQAAVLSDDEQLTAIRSVP